MLNHYSLLIGILFMGRIDKIFNFIYSLLDSKRINSLIFKSSQEENK